MIQWIWLSGLFEYLTNICGDLLTLLAEDSSWKLNFRRRFNKSIGFSKHLQNAITIVIHFYTRILVCIGMNSNQIYTISKRFIPDQAYYIAFSLIMLHTDFFNKNNKHKMQKPDYVKNTSRAIPKDGISNDILEVKLLLCLNREMALTHISVFTLISHTLHLFV
jgi:hypothetical protein